jgi:hypothetical protein
MAGGMAFGVRSVLAFDQGAVCGAVIGRGASGLRTLARVALPGGVLRPHPFEDNVADPAGLQAALRRLAGEVPLQDGGLCLMLPDGVALLSLLDLPAGAEAADYARHRMRGALPYPAEEAVVDVLPLAGRRVLAAAVRRRVVEGYEQAAEKASLSHERIDLAPLAAVGALAREAAAPGTVDVVLGDAAVTLAVPEAGGLRVLRNRRRDPGPDEGQWLREEAERTAALAGQDAARARVVGTGAPAVVAALRNAGLPADTGWSGVRAGLDGSELAWLAAAV